MRIVSEKEKNAVLRLDGEGRFKHFIKFVADTETVWSLWSDGWAMLADHSGQRVFPLWPAREYAELFRTGDWLAYEARAIPLDELLASLFPELRDAHVSAGVFPIPSGQGVATTIEILEAALREELGEYGE